MMFSDIADQKSFHHPAMNCKLMSHIYPKQGDQKRATTILIVRHKGQVAIGGDGQVTIGDTIVKHHSNKIRKLADGKVLAGFASTAADALTLIDKFETKLEEYKNNLLKAAVELAKEWRTDKYLRQLDALLAVADKKMSLLISGDGDVVEPDDGIAAVGSGGPYAVAAARALVMESDLPARKIVMEAMKIAANLCIYTNSNIRVETLK